MATEQQQRIDIASLRGPAINPANLDGLIEPVITNQASPSTKPSRPRTQRIRPGILSRQASEREEAESSSINLQSASEDDDAKQSDTGSMPRRFPTEPNSAASSLRKSRSAQSPSPLSSNYGTGGHTSRSVYTSGGGGGGGQQEASAPSSRSHLPLQSRTSLFSRQVDHDSSRGGDGSEDGASGRGGTDSLSRAKSISSVSSVNSTSSMEAVPFRAAPLGNVRVGYTGYGGRRNDRGRGNTIMQEEQALSSPVESSNSSQNASAGVLSSSPNAGKHRVLPKDPADEWLYRNPPGMGPKSGARNALSTYQTTSKSPNIEKRVGGSIDGKGPSSEKGNSVMSTVQGGRIKPSIRSKLAKRAGKLGIKPLTSVSSDFPLPPNGSLQNLDLSSIPSQVVETRDPNNGSAAGSVTLPAISLSSASIISSDSSSRGSKTLFASPNFSGTSPLSLSVDGDQPKLKTSSVTYAPLVVPKHPPGPPGSGPPPSPGLTGAPSPYHPFALASPLISPQQLADDVDPLAIEKDLKAPEVNNARARSCDIEPKRPKRGSINGLLNHLPLADTTQRHSLPAPVRAHSPQRPSTSPTTVTPAQQVRMDVQAGIARAPAEPSGSNPGHNPSEHPIKNVIDDVALAARMQTYSTRVESDFVFGDILGEGSYSTVLEAWDMKPLREKEDTIGSSTKSSSNLMSAMVGKKITAKQRSEVESAKRYAIKVLDKMHILKEKKQKYVGVEREALSLLIRHPGVITLHWTFQGRDNLYFVTELASHGELLGFIKKLGSFDIECTRYYGAQLVEVIQAMHQAGVLHRDLKPENILLDAEMRIKVADFGSAKLFKKEEESQMISPADDTSTLQSERTRTNSFVGTAEYVCPELLTEKPVSKASDWWAFGCLMYQMMCGRPPFKGASEYQTFQKIMKRDFEYPAGLSIDAIALLDSILVIDPERRYTYKDIKEHAFFNDYDWSTIWNCKPPQLKAGIYTKSSSLAASTTVSSSQENGVADILPSRDTQIIKELEDGSKSGPRSVQDSMNSFVLSDEPLNEKAKEEWEVQDADDDDSSFSDSNNPIAPRRRGLSAGAFARERRPSLGNGNAKKANDFFRMAAGMMSSDSKYESSKLTSSADSRLSTFSPSSVHTAVNTKQASNRRSSNASPFLLGENKNSRAAMSHSKNGSISNQMQSLLATSWAALLLPNESILYSCPILHKITGTLLRNGTKKRHLLLTDFPRLLCIKETNNQLRVKSEVILGLPQLASMPLIHHPWNIEDEEDDDEEEETKAGAAFTASQMRRQSSAGPLLASPTRSHAATMTPTNGESPNPMRGMERRDSYPISRQLSFPTENTMGSTFTINKGGNSSTIISNGLNINSVNSKNSALISTTPANMASTMDTSPNFMTSIEQKNTRTFQVNTPAKSFLYEDPSGDATHWVKSILLAAAANRSDITTMA